MALYCPDYNLLFLGNPRSGSTATVRHLQRHLGGYFVPPVDILNIKGGIAVRHKHCNLDDLLRTRIVTQGQRKELRTFAILRDPRECVLTWYFYHRNEGYRVLDDPDNAIHSKPQRKHHMQLATELSFPEWVNEVVDSGIYNGRNFLRCADGVDAVLRHEHLQQDLNALMKRWGIPLSAPMERHNVTPGKKGTWQDHYTPRAREIVEDVYAEHLAWWRGLSQQ